MAKPHWHRPIKLILIAILFVGADQSRAYFATAPESPAVMNDIAYEKNKDFERTWRLVTVRYREDSKELRFTYANDIAWKAMFSLTPNYPDGAMFAKTAILTENDPSFTSSRTPSASVRYQFMLRNKKKYKETEGWGYALFNADGKLFKDDVKVATQACAACHRIVPERDYVFSRPFQKEFYAQTGHSSFPSGNNTSIKFLPREKKYFAKSVQEYLLNANVESLEGPLKDNAFSGTLDEVVPLLLERAKKLSTDALLFVNPENFTVVQKARKTGCFRIIVFANRAKVRDVENCQ
ncbi:MAG TPA: cytochrome P460 family protein [Bdellovibrionales bacterium]|nr:cytochrome P460 family protein [Bdellovibrionales bacterium]